MSVEFARQMEREVERIAERVGYRYGIKPWYSYAGLFEEPTVRIFVGSHPAGGRKSKRLDQEDRYSERVYQDPGYSSWIDERWEKPKSSSPSPAGQARLQKNVHKVFEAMYGSADWERVLRSTPSFNVIPFRVPDMDSLPSRAWSDGCDWFQRVIQHLRPRLIICNGNADGGLSPWAALRKTEGECIDVRPKANSYIKTGTVAQGPLAGTMIVALPSLSQFGGDDLLQKLGELRDSRPGLFV